MPKTVTSGEGMSLMSEAKGYVQMVREPIQVSTLTNDLVAIPNSIRNSLHNKFSASEFFLSFALPPPAANRSLTFVFLPRPAPHSLPDPRSFNVVDGVVRLQYCSLLSRQFNGRFRHGFD